MIECVIAWFLLVYCRRFKFDHGKIVNIKRMENKILKAEMKHRPKYNGSKNDAEKFKKTLRLDYD